MHFAEKLQSNECRSLFLNQHHQTAINSSISSFKLRERERERERERKVQLISPKESKEDLLAHCLSVAGSVPFFRMIKIG